MYRTTNLIEKSIELNEAELRALVCMYILDLWNEAGNNHKDSRRIANGKFYDARY